MMHLTKPGKSTITTIDLDKSTGLARRTYDFLVPMVPPKQLPEAIKKTITAIGLITLCVLARAATALRWSRACKTMVQILSRVMDVGFQAGGQYVVNGTLEHAYLSDILSVYKVRIKKEEEGLQQEVAMSVFEEDLGDETRVWFINPVPLESNVIKQFIAPHRSYVIVLPMKAHHLFVDAYLEALPTDRIKVIGSHLAGLRHFPQIEVADPSTVISSHIEMHKLSTEMDEYVITIRDKHGTNVAIFVHCVACGWNFHFCYPGQLPWLQRAVDGLIGWFSGGCTTHFAKVFTHELRHQNEVTTKMLRGDWDHIVSVHGGICSGNANSIMEQAFRWVHNWGNRHQQAP